MHPALSTDALRSLPPAIQKSAYAAVGGHSDDFIAMLRTIDDSQGKPKSIWTLLLPLYHGHLDPTKAQRLQQRASEGLGPADADLVVLAFLAVQGLAFAEEVPREACPDIWPGLWLWSQLIAQHDYCLPPHVITCPKDAFLLSFTVMGRIWKFSDAAGKKSIAAEPGFRPTVTKVLALLSGKDVWPAGIQIDGYDTAAHFLHFAVDLENREHHDDLVEGCGGTLRDFATVVVNFVTHLVTKDTQKSLAFLSTALLIIRKTEEVREEFPDLLLECGMATALVIALRKMSAHSLGTHDETLTSGLRMLVSLMFQPRCQVWFAQSLRAGFLRLIASALENPELFDPKHLEAIFIGSTIFLPYRSVLIEFRSSLADMETHMNHTRASQSPAWDAWEGFLSWYDCFLPMAEIHDSSDRVPTRACDNVECDLVSAKADLKRCSCCESVYYCSTDCQRLDWNRGHRKTCTSIRAYSLQNPDLLSSRDRSFLRTIVHEVYKRQISTILMGQLAVMKEAPGRESATLIKQIEGDFAFETLIAPLSHLAIGNVNVGPMWDDQLSRAAASNNRIHLHIIAFPQGPGERKLAKIVPVRMRSAAVGDGLLALVKEIPDGKTLGELRSDPELLAKVEALVRKTGAKDDVFY
ncbi:hypothetical protein FB45DRAFT_941273 [Roridomyces roridus]|uniref:MYND-type domain-containing protein n=1 Tax=Roridomyces roridus TaxID=1738132 RepID=A0AAD7FBY9_9AGAR|nr:hypothetical protein FB45DRAFT_941273 [Roridomyces roridus]